MLIRFAQTSTLAGFKDQLFDQTVPAISETVDLYYQSHVKIKNVKAKKTQNLSFWISGLKFLVSVGMDNGTTEQPCIHYSWMQGWLPGLPYWARGPGVYMTHSGRDRVPKKNEGYSASRNTRFSYEKWLLFVSWLYEFLYSIPQ